MERSNDSEFDCLFIGGTTEWKLSPNNRQLCRTALENGKWLHMGRVNSMRRMTLAKFWGCHSVDGTQLTYAPDARLEQLERWLDFFKGVTKFGVLTQQ